MGSLRPEATGRERFAGVMLFALDELVEGALAELKARRVHNAARLARHAWEFELELTWVMTDPAKRLPRWRSNEARREHHLGADGYKDPRVAELLAAEYERARKVPGSFMPTVERMADDLGRASQYRSEYRKMSYVSHPGFRSITWYSPATEADVERSQRGELVPIPHMREAAAGMVDSVALMLALVVARALDPVEQAFGTSLATDRQRLIGPLRNLAATRNDLTRDEPAAGPAESPPEA